MLSYRHSFHAGNFADVLKHSVTVQILKYLTLKPKPIYYLDTHSGAGAFTLSDSEAQKTGSTKMASGNFGPCSMNWKTAQAWSRTIWRRYSNSIRKPNCKHTRVLPGLRSTCFARRTDWIFRFTPK